jgi:CBS domain-containing protein
MADPAARDIMVEAVVTVSPDTSLRRIAEVLVEHRISGVPVTEADGTLVGIVTESDLLDEEKRRVRLPRTALFGVYLVPERVVREAFEEGETLTAQDIMTKRLVTVREDTPAREAVELMLSRKVNRVPVVREGKLVGLITRADALRALHAHWQATP